MKKSIATKILITIATILLVTDTLLLGLGFSAIYRTVRQTYASYAQSGVAIAASLLKGVDLNKLESDQPYAQSYETLLQTVCDANHLEYLYLYTPNLQQETITFAMVIAGKQGDPLALEERSPGTVISYSLTPQEQQVWQGKKSFEVEETDNQYGHVLSAYQEIYNKDQEVIALVGADVSMEEALQSVFLRYQLMVITVGASFILVLGVLALVLKKRVLKPVQVVNQHMQSFVKDRQAGFVPLEVKGEDELAQMAQSFNSMAQEIDQYVANVQELTAEKERQKAEIQIAHNIQKGFLPPEHFSQEGLRLEAIMIPAKEVGGDFYDYFALSEDTFCLVIADVSGKGISAALFMAHAMTVIRQYASLGHSPAQILAYANDALCLNNAEQMFVTVFIAIYHRQSQLLVYANGGHNPPYLLSDSLQSLVGEGFALGLFEEEEYEEKTIKVKDGDTLFLYTDGITEAMSAQKELFGVSRLEDILKREEQEKCVQTVLQAVEAFAREAPQSDDITMLACCFSGLNHMRIKAKLENLKEVQHFLLDQSTISLPLRKKLCLVVEEIFVNICSYAYEDQEGFVDLFLDVSKQGIELRLCDEGKPFDPTKNEVDVDDYDLDTQIGGLGTWIAFGSVDEVHYEYQDGQNQLTLYKYLKEKDHEDNQNH